MVDQKKQNNVSFIKEDQEDLNDREDEPPARALKGLTIKEESDDELQQSVSKVLSSRSTNTQINFHPVNKLLDDSTKQESSAKKLSTTLKHNVKPQASTEISS